MNIDKSLIPNGVYCYDERGGCPYHKFIKTIELHEENGKSCNLRGECDEECGTTFNNTCKIRVYRCEYMDYTDWEEESLLWDSVKECDC